MDDRSRELGLNNPRRRAQEERAQQEAREAVRAAARGETDAAARGERGADAPDAISGDASAQSPASDAAARGDVAVDAAGASDSSRAGRSRVGRPAARPAARPAPKKQSWWTRGRIAAVSTAVLVVAVLAALVIGFAWLRWFSADDAADLQGTWYLSGTATPIVITEDRINLTDDVSYRYTVNTADKTIQFTFGNLAGEGCYRFSLDRGQLALIDGAFTGSDTLNADLGWTVRALWENLQGNVLPPAEKAGKGVTLLSRTPAAGAAAPSSDRGADADDTVRKAGGEEVIEDDVVGDLAERFPADMGEPSDKAADESADAAGTATDAGADAAGTGTDAATDADAGADTAALQGEGSGAAAETGADGVR